MTIETPTKTPAPSMARRLGRIVLGIALGILLVPALIELASLAGDVSPFKYQGF